MADEKTVTLPEKDYKALLDRMELSDAKLVALEDAVNTPTAESVTKKIKKAVLTGETFKVGGAEYKVKYAVIHHEKRRITEADILADKALQETLVKGGFGVIEKVA